MNNALLNNIATEIVANKVMDDKMKEYEKAQLDEQNKQNQPKDENKENDEDDDDIFKEDEEEKRMKDEMREKRLMDQGVKPKARDRSREKKENKYKYGEYREIEEGEFLDTLLKNKKVVCHFYHTEFEKCKVMDKHLRQIAFEHPETLFVKIDAEKAPFFSVKLNVKVLPTVIFTDDGKAFDRIVGFEGLDGIDDFKTITLIRRLVLAKMIKPKNKVEKGEIKMKKATKLNGYDEEESDEDDDY